MSFFKRKIFKWRGQNPLSITLPDSVIGIVRTFDEIEHDEGETVFVAGPVHSGSKEVKCELTFSPKQGNLSEISTEVGSFTDKDGNDVFIRLKKIEE